MGKTRGVHETTPEVRNRMVGMYEAGLGLREIAAAVNCSQRTVKRWLNRFDKEGSVETRDRCGRKRATTQEQDEAIIRLATQTPITAAKVVLPALGLNCSVDTVRERLHKAGIHNWSPSRKQIQKIPIAAADGASIQQAVWRPTGTQLGKKKIVNERNKNKTKSQVKKKIIPHKSKSKQSANKDKKSSNVLQSPDISQNFSFTSSLHNEQIQCQRSPQTQPQSQSQSQSQSQLQQQVQPQMQEIQPGPLPLPACHPIISSNPSQYNHAIDFIPQTQALYHQQPGLNVSQNWPLDLVQGTHHYSQTQQTAILHEQHLNVHLQNHTQLHNQHNTQLAQHLQGQMQSTIQSHDTDLQHKVEQHPLEHQQELSNLSHGKLNESQDVIINVCSDNCSNSNSSSNENSQNSSIDDGLSNDKNCNISKITRKERLKKKKGGKVKGTLETSVEIRNRMIGMSEAGLSTLSIALAINRSERTVKRWLDRWHKEGNVQTKERKGRRRITTKEQDEAIVAMATQHPLTAAKYVAPALGLKCSVDTIRERLHKAGIHSWKLGKKQGQGNTVHTVHLWQPSGNRSTKVRANSEKKKKTDSKKHCRNTGDNCKKCNKKPMEEPSITKSTVPCSDTMPEVVDIHFQNQSQSSAVLSSTHELTRSSAELAQPQHPPICPQDEVPAQALQTVGSLMQQRSDCRLALSSTVPQLSTQSGVSIAYPSCMIGSTHAAHIEQSDPMNYEPYIWSF